MSHKRPHPMVEAFEFFDEFDVSVFDGPHLMRRKYNDLEGERESDLASVMPLLIFIA